jgi:hypothetical protein
MKSNCKKSLVILGATPFAARRLYAIPSVPSVVMTLNGSVESV